MILVKGHEFKLYSHSSNDNGVYYTREYASDTIEGRMHPLLSSDDMFDNSLDVADRSMLLLLDMTYNKIDFNWIVVWVNSPTNEDKVWLVNKTAIRVFPVPGLADLGHVKCRLTSMDIYPTEISL